MVNIPKLPFRVQIADDTDPFVANALRRHKHYEPCWCGSGRKYKNCHALRQSLPRFEIGRVLSEQDQIFWSSRRCMHPEASISTCKGPVIDAHTIQRKGPLETIIDERNHVRAFKSRLSDGVIEIVSVGWRKASTFPGYCAQHDSALFRSIEAQEFTGAHEQCVLLAFRNLCNELYRKRALVECMKRQRDVLDRGMDLDGQINCQLSISKSLSGQLQSIEEGDNMRAAFERAIESGDFSRFASRCYFFKGELGVVSSSVFQCEFDFQGVRLADLWDASVTADLLSHSIIDRPEGGAIVFVWLKDADCASKMVSSFDQIRPEEKGDIFVQYCFLNAENTYFSPKWWEGLPKSGQAFVTELASTLHYDGGTFSSHQPPLVSWEF